MRQGTILAKHKTFPLALLTYTKSISNGRSDNVNGKGPVDAVSVLVGMKNVSHYKLGSGGQVPLLNGKFTLEISAVMNFAYSLHRPQQAKMEREK